MLHPLVQLIPKISSTFFSKQVKIILYLLFSHVAIMIKFCSAHNIKIETSTLEI